MYSRLVSILMIFVLCFTTLPTIVFAEEVLQPEEVVAELEVASTEDSLLVEEGESQEQIDLAAEEKTEEPSVLEDEKTGDPEENAADEQQELPSQEQPQQEASTPEENTVLENEDFVDVQGESEEVEETDSLEVPEEGSTDVVVVPDEEEIPEAVAFAEIPVEEWLKKYEILASFDFENLDVLKLMYRTGSLGFFTYQKNTTAMSYLVSIQMVQAQDTYQWGKTDLGQKGDATNLDSMKATFNHIRTGNRLRANDNHNDAEGKKPLRVNDFLMAISQIQTNASSRVIGHSGMFPVGENLAWGWEGMDPYQGWYYMEKPYYEAGNYGSAGHYMNLVGLNGTDNATGFAISTKPGGPYAAAYGQVFSWLDASRVENNKEDYVTYTVDEYEKRFDAYRVWIVEQIKKVLGEVPLTGCYNSIKGVDLRWKKVDGATGYDIWRKNRGVWTKVATVGANETQYYDAEVKDQYGKIYVYSVAARVDDISGNYNKKGLGICRLAPPQLLQAEDQGSDKVYVEWTFADKCTGYEVQISDTLDFKKVRKVQVEGRDVLHTLLSEVPAGQTSYVRVRSYQTDVNNITYYSQYTKVKSLTKSKVGDLPEVQLRHVYNSVNGADLRWKSVPGATGYEIWRKNRGVWKKIDTVTGGETVQYFDREIQTEYGRIYVYSVAAVDATGTGPFNEKGRGLCRLAPPSSLEVSLSKKNVIVQWGFADKSTGYEVQVSKTLDFKEMEKYPVEGRNTLTTILSGLEKGTYYVRVRSYQTDANNITYYSQYTKVRTIEI